MGRVGLAFRMFFRILGNGDFARETQRYVERGALPAPVPAPTAPAPRPAVAKVSARSDALNLLAVLQREGRLVDFLKEDLSAYNDAQIGSAVRDVHRDCAAALERVLALRPLQDEPEGAAIQVLAGFDAAKVRLTGNLAGQGPYKGILRHPGWTATRLDLPEWAGSADSAKVVAPAEVEITGP